MYRVLVGCTTSAVAFMAFGALACGPVAKDKTPATPETELGAVAAQPRTGNQLGSKRDGRVETVLFIGTSLTAGLGLQPDQAFPALVQQKADSAGVLIRAINAGVSGETSAGALHRIAWVLRQPADVVVIETGANDALRALPVVAARANIAAILDSVRAAKPRAKIFLVQMEAPPNLGQAYTTQFHDMYVDLAREKGVALIPFLLNGVAGHAELNQADGVHPNRAGEERVADNVWQALRRGLRVEG